MGIKDFYLQKGNDADTLFEDIEVRKKNRKYKAVHFIGEPALRITGPKVAPRWYFEKKKEGILVLS